MLRRSRLLTLAITNVLVTASATVGVASSTAHDRSVGAGHRSAEEGTNTALAAAASVAPEAVAELGHEYVVAYEGDAGTARREVQAAGGQVVELLPEIGLARVRAGADGFLGAVRDRAGIVGAARNHAVGASRPGMPHRFADEHPSRADRAAAGPAAPAAPGPPAAPAAPAAPPAGAAPAPVVGQGGAQGGGPPRPGHGHDRAGRRWQTSPTMTIPRNPSLTDVSIPTGVTIPQFEIPELPPWVSVPRRPAPETVPAPPSSQAPAGGAGTPPAGSPSPGQATAGDRTGTPSTGRPGTSVAPGAPAAPAPPGPAATDPLAARQWDMRMIGATAEGAHRHATGAGVEVGVIDTGVDGRHPDLAPNLDRQRSRNFTVDRPASDGPCEVTSCVDPADADHNGHGTHVAATLAAARNGAGVVGVAPRARLVSLRAGQDSGYFFVYEVAEALVAAADMGLDVVNMSFYTDPWLYNCRSRDDYLQGDVTDEELAQQRLVREVMMASLEYAHAWGVTLVAAAGNGHVDLGAPERIDPTSPGFPPGSARTRTVRRSCLELPVEGPHVIAVGSVGPSGIKADYSNYGEDRIDLVAPGGWLHDRVGTPQHRTPDNLVLSAYPLAAAVEQGLARPDGEPLDAFSVRECDATGACAFYTTMQGTSMASPHVAGVVALIVERHGRKGGDGPRLHPDRVARILRESAMDAACPPGGTQDYTAFGLGPETRAVCQGTPGDNGLYGEGVVSAARAVTHRPAGSQP